MTKMSGQYPLYIVLAHSALYTCVGGRAMEVHGRLEDYCFIKLLLSSNKTGILQFHLDGESQFNEIVSLARRP